MVGAAFQSGRKYRKEDLEREEISPVARGTVPSMRPIYRAVDRNSKTEVQAGMATTALPCPRTDI
jgi:hypothetical protein